MASCSLFVYMSMSMESVNGVLSTLCLYVNVYGVCQWRPAHSLSICLCGVLSTLLWHFCSCLYFEYSINIRHKLSDVIFNAIVVMIPS